MQISEQNLISSRMEELTRANRNYYEQGVDFLELAQAAPSLYLSQTVDEKAKLLRTILSNCTLNGATLTPTYRKPFDLIAKGIISDNKLGDWDSNPDSAVQSRMPCHWTISQNLKTNRRLSSNH